MIGNYEQSQSSLQSLIIPFNMGPPGLSEVGERSCLKQGLPLSNPYHK